MALPCIYVPFSAIFPGEGDDFASFCALLRSLSRTDTILWCARLSLILSNPQNRDEATKQRYCIGHFCDADEIARGAGFERAHPGARPFFREQLLELMRWACLLAEDAPNDGQSFEDPEVRRRFLKAALMASDVWRRRVYRDGLPTTGDQRADRRRSIIALREGVTLTPPDIMRVLVRGDVIYRAAFLSKYPDAGADFLADAGLTLDQYLTFVSILTVLFGSIYPDKVTPQNTGGFRFSEVRAGIPADTRRAFDNYARLESQTPDNLRAALWGDRQPGDVDGSEPFDPKALRERPLLWTKDGRGIILDLVFYAEKAAVGPLFALAAAWRKRCDDERAKLAFQAFGRAFEGYANGILQNMYPESTLLSNRLVCNLHATGKKRRRSDEIADACLNDVSEAVLFECKGVFVPEGSTHDAEKYLVTLREKYGAQLARWITDIAAGKVTPLEHDWSRVERVYPVLVAYDERMDRPGHAELFAEEFAKALEPDHTLQSGFMKKGRFTVAPLTVMTINDLELLESSIKHFRLIDLLNEYAGATRAGIRVSLHDYLAYAQGGKYRLSGSMLAERALASAARGDDPENVPAYAVSGVVIARLTRPTLDCRITPDMEGDLTTLRARFHRRCKSHSAGIWTSRFDRLPASRYPSSLSRPRARFANYCSRSRRPAP
jgi:hypothetical protein